MQIIDTHTHIFSDEHHRTYFAKAKGRVGRALSIHFWTTLDEGKNFRHYPLSEFLSFVAAKDDLRAVGSVDMDGDVYAQLGNLEELLKNGKIVAIKLYPGYQHFYASDGRVSPVAELCEKYNRPLIFHSGDFYDIKKGAILKYSHPTHVDGLAIRHPDCKIVIAHFGFPNHLETANVVSKNKNVYTEVSGTIDRPSNKKEADALLARYAADLKRVFAYFPDVKRKTMFGTDYAGEGTPLNQVGPYMRLVEMVFDKKERQYVFYELAEKLFFPAD